LREPERTLSTILRGSSIPLTSDLIDAARQHRVHLLVAAAMTPPQGLSHPELLRELRIAAGVDAFREQQVRLVLDALSAEGVESLLLKGAGLAYLLYPQPHLRARVDTDVLVEKATIERTEHCVTSIGWTRPEEPEMELAAGQRHYVKQGPLATLHLDVHWRLANPRVFAEASSFAELRARAIDVPALGPAARTLSMPDALWLACVHRVAHHDDAVDLLWLWDIHLLVGVLTDAERVLFVELATRASMSVVCRRSLTLAAEWFGTPGAASLIESLRLAGRPNEPSARFVGGLPRIAVLRSDFDLTSGWRARRRLIVEHALPPAGYVRALYPRWPAWLLPLAYVFRIVRGLPRWFRAPR
jgi:hypothetical protein